MVLCESVVLVVDSTAFVDSDVNAAVDVDIDSVDIAGGGNGRSTVFLCVRGSVDDVVTGCVDVSIRGLFTKTIAFGPVVLSVVVTVP
jgi:hypothetical protein